MSHLIKSEFIRKDGSIVYQETSEKKLSEYGCVFLCVKTSDLKDDDKKHMVYKLTKSPDKQGYFWAGLWNSCCIVGREIGRHDYQYYFDTVADAVEAILEKTNYSVAMTHCSDYIEGYSLSKVKFVTSLTEE